MLAQIQSKNIRPARSPPRSHAAPDATLRKWPMSCLWAGPSKIREGWARLSLDERGRGCERERERRSRNVNKDWSRTIHTPFCPLPGCSAFGNEMEAETGANHHGRCGIGSQRPEIILIRGNKNG
jgi:hypothetical protein